MTLYDRPRLQVLIADRDVTDRCDNIVFSATDQGGFEICTLGLPSADRPRKGQAITIRQGLEVAWAGRVAEIGDHSQHDHATKSVGGEGWVALLRDSPYSMIYVDRDLTQWSDPSVTRQIALAAGNFQLGSSQVGADQSAGNPALVQSILDSWATPFEPINESWYDAGPGNLIASLFYSLSVGEAAIGTWQEFVYLSNDANLSVVEVSANLHASAPVAGYFSPPTAYRFALLQHVNATTAIGTQGAIYNAYWANVAAYGNHGLALRGPDPGGFYPSDIARHALSQVSGVSVGTIIDSTGYVAPRVVYRTPTAVDQILSDMAALMGWPWGVWEPATILGQGPRLDFRPPPSDATCVVTKAECDQLDVTSRVGDLYNQCDVTFVDAAGTAGMATVTLANAQLNEAAIATRTLLLDIGLGSQAAAAAFGAYALALSQIAARAAGQATLPVSVRLPGGGSKPACLIRPGIDRLRIVDLQDGGPLLDLGTVRRDVFRISRAETTAAQDGSLSTVVELDSGADLIATLQARLALTASVVGAGATG